MRNTSSIQSLAEFRSISALTRDLKLGHAQLQALSDVCVATARNCRVAGPCGYAEFWKQGVREQVFSSGLVQRIVGAIEEAPDRLDEVLSAVANGPPLAPIVRSKARGQYGCASETEIYSSLALNARD